MTIYIDGPNGARVIDPKPWPEPTPEEQAEADALLAKLMAEHEKAAPHPEDDR